MKKERNAIKIVITILAVLLILSLVALAGIFLYNKFFHIQPTTVTIPDNLITPEADEEDEDEVRDDVQTENRQESQTAEQETTVSGNTTERKASSVSLYARHPEDNMAISFENMFPGDTITRNFCVQVSYHGDVKVHYNAVLRSGDEQLKEALSIRIKMIPDGSVLYDGPMKDMPSSVTYALSSKESTTTELYYEITVYLPTTVGNAYQNKRLVADFKWWTEETGNLEASPKTGDMVSVALLGGLVLCLGFACMVFILQWKRKEEQMNEAK